MLGALLGPPRHGLAVVRNIESHLGGRWEYDRGAREWRCNDGKRVIARRAAMAPKYDGDDETVSVEYWLYGAGAPQRAEHYLSPKPKSQEKH